MAIILREAGLRDEDCMLIFILVVKLVVYRYRGGGLVWFENGDTTKMML